MELHPHWARAWVDRDGNEHPRGEIAGVGWSDDSPTDARRDALERARRIAARLRRGERPDAYPYPRRALREPIVSRIEGPDGTLQAAITRNSYGALILNAATAMFVDIDDSERLVRPRRRRRLFGRRDPEPPGHPAAAIPPHIPALMEDRGLSGRLYETAAGHRLLSTGRPYDPTADETTELLTALRADDRYITLTRAQRCFRARITPKPWRCGLSAPPGRFPYDTDRSAQRFSRWLDRYNEEIGAWATATLVASYGSDWSHPDVAPIVAAHDREACAEGRPLA